MSKTYQHRVEAGAKLLDEKVPGWYKKIDVSDLDLQRDCRCVLGQLFLSFGVGCVHIVYPENKPAFEFGFANPDLRRGGERWYKYLTSLWIEQIHLRLAKDQDKNAEPARILQKA